MCRMTTNIGALENHGKPSRYAEHAVLTLISEMHFVPFRFYSSNATHIPLLIELLTVLPEEVDSHSLRLGLNRREEFRIELGEAASTVIELLVQNSSNIITCNPKSQNMW